jgi:hypothetical protein
VRGNKEAEGGGPVGALEEDDDEDEDEWELPLLFVERETGSRANSSNNSSEVEAQNFTDKAFWSCRLPSGDFGILGMENFDKSDTSVYQQRWGKEDETKHCCAHIYIIGRRDGWDEKQAHRKKMLRCSW